jgi:hypothetical protein
VTRPLPPNRSPQTLALPGFVVSGIPKLWGLRTSGDSVRSCGTQGSGRAACLFERVQTTATEPGIDRALTRSPVHGAPHLSAFKCSASSASGPSPPRSTTPTIRHLNAFKRTTKRNENARCVADHPAGPSFERVQMTSRCGSPGAANRRRRRPVLLIPIPTGGTAMPPPQ